MLNQTVPTGRLVVGDTGVRPDTVAVVALLDEGSAFFVTMKLLTEVVLVTITLAAARNLFPDTVRLAEMDVLAGMLPNKLLAVIFLETGTVLGASMTRNRSSELTDVAVVNCVIFLSAMGASY